MAFVAQAADGSTIRYVDGKRYLWLASLTGPLVPIVGVALYFLSGGNPLATFFPLAYTFLFVPLADAIFGEDTHNPPEEVVPAMSRDNYYRVLLYVAIVLLFAQFFVVAWFIGTHSLPWWSFLALTLGAASPAARRSWSGTSSATRRAAPTASPRRSSTDWSATATSASSTTAAITCTSRRPRTASARAWASRSTSSCCARFPARSAAAGRWSASAWQKLGRPVWSLEQRDPQVVAADGGHRRRAAGDVRLDHGAVPA